MPCPPCAAATGERPPFTGLGYRTFRCSACRCVFNERTGTPVTHLQYPTDLVLLVVLGRLRATLSVRDLAAMVLTRGGGVTHDAVRAWDARVAPC